MLYRLLLSTLDGDEVDVRAGFGDKGHAGLVGDILKHVFQGGRVAGYFNQILLTKYLYTIFRKNVNRKD